MKIDATVMTANLETIGSCARQVEDIGYDGLYTAETRHDPFLPLVLAAGHTERIDLGTAIAVAFPRSPIHLANIGHDLQRDSRAGSSSGSGRRSGPISRSGSARRSTARRPECES